MGVTTWCGASPVKCSAVHPAVGCVGMGAGQHVTPLRCQHWGVMWTNAVSLARVVKGASPSGVGSDILILPVGTLSSPGVASALDGRLPVGQTGQMARR